MSTALQPLDTNIQQQHNNNKNNDSDDDCCMTLDEMLRNEQQEQNPQSSPHNNNINNINNKQSSRRSSKAQNRRRRRSSARFLRLSGRFGTADELPEEEATNEQLSEMYRTAIQMNAENRINSANSWGLKLIDNLDKIIEKSQEDASTTNFTKASCSLDASVKIYSYRVDDVHLSSYKVLANLNRTDRDDDGDTENLSEGNGSKNRKAKRSGSSRAEATLVPQEKIDSTLNMSKLDLAYDVDPLFHKMSKAFDEGGAKGLLLVNLGVSSTSCQILFDSKDHKFKDGNDNQKSVEDEVTITSCNSSIKNKQVHKDDGTDEGDVVDDEACEDNGESITSNENELRVEEQNRVKEIEEKDAIEGVIHIDLRENNQTTVNIENLKGKLNQLLTGNDVSSFSLVPQLQTMREALNDLDKDGYSYVNALRPKTPKSKKYANTDSAEKEAEDTIRKEALERSRVSLEGNNLMDRFGEAAGDEVDDIVADVWGDDGGDDYDDDDAAFDDFVAMDDNAGRYSMNGDSISIIESPISNGTDLTTKTLNAICTIDSSRLSSGGDYAFFDTKALEKATNGNLWAGAAHWKRSQREKKTPNHVDDALDKQDGKSSRKKRTTKKKETKMIDFTAEIDPEMFLKPKVTSRSRTDPNQISQAVKDKQNEKDNLLPHDAGIQVDSLARLFMRPAMTVQQFQDSRQKRRVGFVNNDESNVFTYGDYDDCDDGDSYGGGFELAETNNESSTYFETDNFNLEMDDVRKVEKVRIGYAAVAKKVDVRLLKRDLWADLKDKVEPDESTEKAKAKAVRSESKEDFIESEKEDPSVSEESIDSETFQSEPISFSSAVNRLDEAQLQNGVTVPFYFICMLHLANEHCLKLDSNGYGLNDFVISKDDGKSSKDDDTEGKKLSSRKKRDVTKFNMYTEKYDESEDEDVDNNFDDDDSS